MTRKKAPTKRTRKPVTRGLKPADKTATLVHLADTTNDNAGHALAHVRMAKRAAGNKASLDHNLRHAVKHAEQVKDHSSRLMDKMKKDSKFNKAFKDLKP